MATGRGPSLGESLLAIAVPQNTPTSRSPKDGVLNAGCAPSLHLILIPKRLSFLQGGKSPCALLPFGRSLCPPVFATNFLRFLTLTLFALCFARMTTPAAEEAVDSNPSSIRSPGGNAEKRHAIARWNRQRSAPTKCKTTLWLAIPCFLVVIALTLGLGLGLGLHHTPEATPVRPIVDLGYARYQGSNSSGVAQWLGIRYAAVPTGSLRFASPEAPPKLKGVQSATKVRQRQGCMSIWDF